MGESSLLNNREKAKGVIAGILAVILWGIIPIVFKVGVSNAAPATLLFFRFLFAIVLFAPFVRTANVISDIFESPALFFKAGLSLFVSYYFFSNALTNMTASAYVIIYSLNPIINLYFLKIRFSPSAVFGSILAVLGVTLSLGDSIHDFSTSMKGVAFILFGIIGWSYYTKILTAAHKNYSDTDISFFTHIASFFSCSIWWICSGAKMPQMASSFFAVALAFAIVSPFAFFFFSYSLRRTTIFGVASQFLDPMVSLGLAAIFLHETLSISQAVAFFIIALAVCMIVSKK